MRSLGLDIGDKRTGVAISDPQGLLAVPLTVIVNQSEEATIGDIIKLVEQHRIERIVVGLPRSLSGSLGPQADKVTTFVEKLRNSIASRSPEPFSSFRVTKGDCHSEGLAEALSKAKGQRPKNLAQGELRTGAAKQSHLTSVDIQLWDERFSTVAVEKLMVKAGTKKNKRNEHRDALAAAFILQGFLDSCHFEPFASCHSEGEKRPKNLLFTPFRASAHQGKLREESS